MTSILYHLMRTPSAYKTLTHEIDTANASGQLSYPFIKHKEVIKLPYLDACCKEGMRLHPSVGLTLPRNVPARGCEIAGNFFTAGTRVGVNAAVIHRNRDIFGDDADDFVPECWFRPDAANMDKYMFQVPTHPPPLLRTLRPASANQLINISLVEEPEPA
jgi:cytochrome P450